MSDISLEPNEATLPPKPHIEDVLEDTQIPGSEEVPESEFLPNDVAEGDDTVDNAETTPEEVEGTEEEKYDGGEIPPATETPDEPMDPNAPAPDPNAPPTVPDTTPPGGE